MSRFITYPSVVDKVNGHTVVLIDATKEDVNRVGIFCESCVKDYDIYLYYHDIGDLPYLDYIVGHSDRVLLHEDSKIYIKNFSALTKIGNHQEIADALEYFSTYDTIEETT